MKNEAIELTIYRRNGHLFVVPAVLSDFGFRSLHEVIDVDGPSDLLRALEAGLRLARAATALPKTQRFSEKPAYWNVLGCSDYDEFVKGTIAVAIVAHEQRTRIDLLVPSADGAGLVGTQPPEYLGPNTPLTDVAQRALRLFAQHTGDQ
jgi:hypothetical protein